MLLKIGLQCICFLVVWTSIEISEYNSQLSVSRSISYTYIPLWNQVTETRMASTQNIGIYQELRYFVTQNCIGRS